jgi:D-alanyl-D-alanine carboxypeptidase
MDTKSYLGKVYLIDDKEARVRQAKNLLKYVVYQEGDDVPAGKKIGQPKIIPKGTKVRVSDARALDNKITFVLVQSDIESPAQSLGWTSADNLKGDFINETIGELVSKDASKKGLNAAWDKGKYLGQRTLVEIVGNKNQTERIVLERLDNYQTMAKAAASDGVTIAIESGFRTYAEQEYLYKLYKLNPKKYNLAAEPGTSNHQDGQAFDLNAGGFDGHPVYDWLKTLGPKFGFIRTVNNEPWHWEYRPDDAAKLAAKGKFKMPNVKF